MWLQVAGRARLVRHVFKSVARNAASQYRNLTLCEWIEVGDGCANKQLTVQVAWRERATAMSRCDVPSRAEDNTSPF